LLLLLSLLLLRPKHMDFRYYHSKVSFFFFFDTVFFSSCHSHATNFRTLTHAHGELYSYVCAYLFFSFFGLPLMLCVCVYCCCSVFFFSFFFLKSNTKLNTFRNYSSSANDDSKYPIKLNSQKKIMLRRYRN
jgi:hypothetical protein